MRLIVTGVLFLIGGLSGTVALRGTGSSGALAVVGIILIIFGAISLGKDNGGSDYSAEPTEADRERDAEQWAEYQRVRAEQAREQQAEARAQAAEEAAEELARPWAPDPNDPRTQRLEAIFMMHPAARDQVDEVISRTRQHLDPDAQLNLALETARRVRDGARA
jgi:hypothetical protein